jgi:nucleoside-diphosphate-sugar epimerase
VLVTGGYGCIGSWIVKALLERGADALIYDLKEDPHRLRLVLPDEQASRVPFLPGDVTDLPRLAAVLREQKVTQVIHLAALQVPACQADPLLGAKVNVLGTLAVFEAVRACGGQVERLVYASSAAVFGPREGYPPGPLGDDARPAATTHYGWFKVCNEGNARVYFQAGLSSVGLRPWTVYGVGRDLGVTSEPTKAIKSLALGRPYRIKYGGTQDMQWAPDVAETFVRCLERPYRGAKVYNLRGHVVDLPTLHRVLCEAEPAAARLITHGDQQLPLAYDMSDDALQRELGAMPRTPLAEGVRRTLEHFRRLAAEGRLDTADLDAAPAPPPATPLREG